MTSQALHNTFVTADLLRISDDANMYTTKK